MNFTLILFFIISLILSFHQLVTASGTFTHDGRLPNMEKVAEMSCLDEFCLCAACEDGVLALVHTIPEDDSERKRKITRILSSPRKHIYKLLNDQEEKDTIAVILTGIPSDCQYLLNYLRKLHEDYRKTYAKPPPLTYLAEEISSLLHDYSLAMHIRPLSVQVILAQAMNKPVQIESSGGYTETSPAIIMPGYIYKQDDISKITSVENEDEERARNILRELRNEKWNELSCDDAISHMQKISKKYYGIDIIHSSSHLVEQLVLR